MYYRRRLHLHRRLSSALLLEFKCTPHTHTCIYIYIHIHIFFVRALT